MATNSWEEAFGTMVKPDEIDPDIKQRQREIQQQDWFNELPNFGETLTDLGRISKLLKDSHWSIEGETTYETIERMVKSYETVNNQLHSVKQALRK